MSTSSSPSALDEAKFVLIGANIDFNNLPTKVDDPVWEKHIYTLMPSLNHFMALKQARCDGEYSNFVNIFPRFDFHYECFYLLFPSLISHLFC